MLMFFWLGFIWFVSSLPAASLPKLDLLRFDKLSHLGVYLVLSLLTFINFRKGFFRGLSRWDVLCILSSLAALEEAHQVWVLNRQVSALDLAANLLGIFLGYFIIIRIVYPIKSQAHRGRRVGSI